MSGVGQCDRKPMKFSGGMRAMRTIYLLPALIAAIAFPSSNSPAQTVKVGIINTYSGPLAAGGDQLERGISLYMKLHEKDLPEGVKIELIKRDDTGPNPEVAKRLAQELITREHVQYLTGFIWSPNAAAAAPIATEAKVPEVIMNAAGVSITRASPYIIRDSFTLWQTSLPIAPWAAKQGWKKAYTAVSD